MQNEMKYLVTWVEANGFVRGQAVKSFEEAQRMYDYAAALDGTQYAECRKIGVRLWHFPQGARMPQTKEGMQ